MMRQLGPVAVLIGVWGAITWSGLLPPFILPPPGAVVIRLAGDASMLARHGLVTLVEVCAGLGIGVASGFAVACMMQMSAGFRRVVEPFVAITQAVPVFVLAPVLTLWLGYGIGPKVAMAVLLVFFPVTTALLEGMATVPEATRDLARIARAGRWREMVWLRLPHAVPHLAAGVKIAATYAPAGAVIGEWIGASQGLGFLMLRANARMETDLMFAALSCVVVMTILLRRAVDRISASFDG